jgi:NRAMP (natural resistance-associated macrophage protein)-like metal ion transporter
MYWISRSIHTLNRLRRQMLVFFAVLGPGIIVLVADNDAGCISTYAVTGSKYGFSILWVVLLLLPMAYFVQEMPLRLGAVTKRGLAESIFEGFGPFWGWFTLADLALVNWLTLITEYIGMTAAMSLFGVPPWITVAGVTAVLMSVTLTGKYWTFEKVTLLFVAFNLIYIPAAFWAMDTASAPGWSEVLRGLVLPAFPGGLTGELLFVILAVIGTTITPWQIFFQQSAVVDKGLDIHDIRFGRLDTVVGAVLTCVVAAFIIITTGAAFFYHHPPVAIEDAAQTAEAIVPMLPHGQGAWARSLFAIGLFDAGFLGALCITLSSSWAFGEVFGWAHSLNTSVKDAPWFRLVYILMLVSAGAIVFIPGAPLITITMFVQVVAVTLLPAALIFLVLILNDPSRMGKHVNTPLQNVVNWGIIIVVVIMSTLFAMNTLFPGLFGGTT